MFVLCRAVLSRCCLTHTPLCPPQEHLAEAAVHRYGRRILLQLLDPDCSRYLPPHLHAFLHPAQPATTQVISLHPGWHCLRCNLHTLGGTACAAICKQPGSSSCAAVQSADEQGGTLGVSKKSPDVRRAELLGTGAKSLAAAITSACRKHACAWLRSPTACDVLVEVARGSSGGEGCAHLIV